MTGCHTFGLVIEDFTAGTGFLIFGYGGFTLTFTSNCFAHTFPSLSARRGLSFSLMSCLHVACDAFAKLDSPKMEVFTFHFRHRTVPFAVMTCFT